MSVPTYGVTVTHEDGLWVAVVDGLPADTNGATDVEHFHDLDVEVRDLIAGLVDVDPESFDLAWRYVLGDADVTERIDLLAGSVLEAETTAAAASDAAAALGQARTEVIRTLQAAGLSQRTIADVLQLSHQRVGQLWRAATSTPAAS